MIEIKLDENEVKKMYIEKLEEHMDKMDKEFLFWDTDDLVKQTRLSWGTIQKEFFYDPKFIKYKLGRKWLFPAKETKEFLMEWAETKRY